MARGSNGNGSTTTAVATRNVEDGQRVELANQIHSMRPTIAKMLERDDNAVARFDRIVMRYYVHATNADMVGEKQAAAMLRIDPRSFALACIDALADGLMPDGKQGAIVPRGKVAVWTPMWRGLFSLARRGSDQICEFRAQVVYQIEIDKRAFVVDLGSNRITHTPWQMLGINYTPRNEDIACAYARATVRDGSTESTEFRILWRDNLDKRRAMSGNPNDPRSWSPAWEHWYSEMCQVKAARALFDWLPVPTAYIDAIERSDERDTKVRQLESGPPMIDAAQAAAPKGLAADIGNASAALSSASAADNGSTGSAEASGG